MLKRVLDVLFSLLNLVFLMPLFLCIILAIWIKDGNPIFFVQKRIGLGGKPFGLYKFRTMVDSPLKNKQLATSSDKRITKLGHFLRYSKLDELPQLWNVLRGDISFVGYRPEIPYYVDKYTKEQKEILNYKPGIIDPATLYFSRYENEILEFSDDIEKDYINNILPKKLELSLGYAKRATTLSDIKYIVLCIIQLFNKKPNK